MTDAIGRRLEVNDYVAAVLFGGDVSLFQVVGLKENTRSHKRFFARKQDMLVLKRVVHDNSLAEVTQNKPVLKRPSQVVWVDHEHVMVHLLSK